MTVVEDIKKIKKQLRWTNADLAKAADIPVSTVAKILSGSTTNPRQNSINAMEKAVLRAANQLGQTGGKASMDYSGDAPAGNTLGEPPYVYGSEVRREKDDSALAAGQSERSSIRHPGLYTVEDYLALPEDRRMELINGRFYDMAAPSGVHQKILLHIWETIDLCIKEHELNCEAQCAPFDVQIFDDDHTVVQPDVMVFCTRPSEALEERAHSAPDFVAEVLSPSTAFRDRTLKLFLYRNAGVKEVWNVSPADQKVLVYRFSEGTTDPDEYTFHDTVPLGISGNRCSVDFSGILKYLPSRQP